MIKFAFFGSSEFSIHVLEVLKTKEFLPSLIITTPDKPKGRGLVLSSTPVKLWAEKNNIPVLDPAKLDDVFIKQYKGYPWIELFIVASYGKIIPDQIINLPEHKTLNVHPSLLPNYRGASPIQSAITDDAKDTGVTIIRLDKEMDHGPIVTVENIHFDEWPTYEAVEEKLGSIGGNLLAKILLDWIDGKIKEVNQDHSQATFTKKIVKEDGLLDPADLKADASTGRAYLAFRKIQAYHSWPGAYFFVEKKNPLAPLEKKSAQSSNKIRVKITSASWKNNKLIIEKVIPEGKKEMLYRDFLNR
jgi:methionyl-tRNA formyltransferase